MIYALTRNDQKYLEIVKRYRNEGKPGKREIDHFKNAFHSLMAGMAETNKEILGQIYMDWNISNKYSGQFFTPSHIARMMAAILPSQGSILDPTCGAGVMLIAAAKTMTYEQANQAFFVGQDLDPTCVKMCALNLAFFNLNGHALQGNTLALEVNYGFRTIRSPFGGTIRELTQEEIERIKPVIRRTIESQPKQSSLF
jgi:type I restriction-modification system DNA methylase subunit